jgi:hypothetical protein
MVNFSDSDKMLEKMLNPDCLRSHLGARTEVGSGTSQSVHFPLSVIICGDSVLCFTFRDLLKVPLYFFFNVHVVFVIILHLAVYCNS